jgi:hypothetical protein
VKVRLFPATSLLLALSATAIAQDANWQPITGAENLRQFMSGLKVERTLAGGEVSRGEYNADGTGTLFSWGAAMPRTWSIKGSDQICIADNGDTLCYRTERNTVDPDLYGARDNATGRLVEFRVTDGRAVVQGKPEDIGDKGSAATPSAAELAVELSNPNTAVASLNFKNQFRWFEGDLTGADRQTSYTLIFQPTLPFVLPSGDKILWRPAVPLRRKARCLRPGVDAQHQYRPGRQERTRQLVRFVIIG